MSWEKVKLGDVTDSCLGKMLDQNKNRGNYQPYLANVNVRWGEFDLSNLPQMRFEEKEQERCGLKYGDLVICEGGEPGRCAIWKDQVPNMKIQKALHRVRVHADMDYRYLYYWFLNAGYHGALDQYFTGATIKHMPGDKLKSIIIDKPSLQVQSKIGDILWQYDMLIENNQKQIKLLEEAAQRLYKEWFVDLHFPGYENTPVVDGVPEGWSECHLSDVAEVNTKNISKGYLYDYVDYVDLSSISHGAINDVTRYNLVEAPGRAKRIAQDGDIIWGMVRPNLRSYALVLHPSKTNVFSTGFAVISAKTVPFTFLYSLVVQDSFVGYLINCTNGSAYPAVKPEHFENAKIIRPCKELLDEYHRIVEPMYRKQEKLYQEIKLLSEARDRLLPKLMNGEMEG